MDATWVSTSMVTGVGSVVARTPAAYVLVIGLALTALGVWGGSWPIVLVGLVVSALSVTSMVRALRTALAARRLERRSAASD